MGVDTVCRVLFWKNMDIYGKTVVFLGGYDRIGEIPHGRIWLDWGLQGMICNALRGNVMFSYHYSDLNNTFCRVPHLKVFLL